LINLQKATKLELKRVVDGVLNTFGEKKKKRKNKGGDKEKVKIVTFAHSSALSCFNL
jgi:hypothetical protein